MTNLELIGEEDKIKIAKILLPAIEKFYEDPENERKFELWMKKRNKQVK